MAGASPALCALVFVLASAAPFPALAAAEGFWPTREHVQEGDAAGIRVLSSRNDLVTGGDALVEIDRIPDGAPIAIFLNGRDVSAAFREGPSPDSRRGTVTGLKLRDNQLEVRAGPARASLRLTNWPAQGPVISGPHEQPFICMTDQFRLPVTDVTLGPATSADCEAATRVDYVYRSRDGGFRPLPGGTALPPDLAELAVSGRPAVPFIVEIETGVINRAIYQTSRLRDAAGWNGGLVYHFGGGCPGGMYIQGRTTGGVLEEEMLARGYAMASSTLNVFGNNCDDLLASETMMMVKERFVERFGPPDFTIGWGCSGGSYQAQQIGDNYPGLLDGIVVGCSFPDVGHAAVSVHSFGARLIYNYYKNNKGVPWTDSQIVAVSGLPDWTSLEVQGDRGDRIDPRGVCNPAIPVTLLYDPVRNPRGARCSIYDHAGNSYGRDPVSGFARRPLDNLGVQYGLEALNAGVISPEQFLDLNEKIGGVDIDAKFTRERTTGDPIALRRAYRSGRFLSGGGGLATMPIIDYRAYSDFRQGDPHQRFHSFSFRERLIQANGNADNQIMLVEDGGRSLFSLASPVLQEALDGMEQWIRAVLADRSDRPPRAKVIAAKPPSLVDACYRADGAKVAERQQYEGDTVCNRLYPPHANPYIAAGAPVANDVVKCTLKPIDTGDYVRPFTAPQMTRLVAIFPQGVCDYTRAGHEQQPLAGTWLSFGPAGKGEQDGR